MSFIFPCSGLYWFAFVLLSCVVASASASVAVAAVQPNFIFILTDDQDSLLGSMQALPNTLQLIASQGMTFENTFIATPICCPSRTETISGRTFHNLLTQPGPKCMHAAAQYNVFNNTQSMFQIFQHNGYKTGSFGKLTNDMANYWCNSKPLTNGFDRINCPCQYNDFYGLKYYDKYMNGSSKLYELALTENAYETSYVGNASMDFLQDMATADLPFLMWIGPHAPHYPSTPANWYADRFANSTAPLTPNYNQHAYMHHDFVGSNPAMTSELESSVDQLWRDRLRSLLSVDDIVFAIDALLQKHPNVNDKTYILLTSDHGYHLGQFRLPCSKQQPYETELRIPMFMRGPNIAANTKTAAIVGNIDILPTFLDLAGIKYESDAYDGRSWANQLIPDFNAQNNYPRFNAIQKASDWRTMYLSEYWSVGTYGSDHCTVWYPKGGSNVPGQNVHPPLVNADNEAWMVDVTETNNWRAIRILNASMNVMYAEFVDHGWTPASFAEPYFYEYYDVSVDEWEMDNAYAGLSDNSKMEFHQLLMTYGQCAGTDCWY